MPETVNKYSEGLFLMIELKNDCSHYQKYFDEICR
jgi:hypothetical protein